MIAVNVGRFDIRLSVVPIGEIKPHERTIPSLLSSITSNIRKTGYQRDPVLIDERSHLALDGMHRLKSLKQLGARYVACALLDAFDDSIKIERWLRTFIAPGPGLIDSLVKTFEMNHCSNFRAAIRSVEMGRSKIALLSRHDCYTGGKDWKISEVYRKMGESDKLCERSHVDVDFLEESEKFGSLVSDSVRLLYPARLNKHEIAKFAARRELLPYKTTRYIVPVRPMGLCFPLSVLRNDELHKCNEALERIVKFSKVTLEPKNVWYEGRRYSERLAIFGRTSRASREGTIRGQSS